MENEKGPTEIELRSKAMSVDSVSDVAEIAVKIVESAAEKATDAVQEVVEKVTDTAQDLADKVPEPVAELAKKVYTILDLSGFIANVGQDFADGDVTIADILRVVPRLAAELQKFEISGKEKGELALAAVHAIVDTYVPESSRSMVNSLADTIVPVAIQNVLDIAKGRVSFAAGVQNAAVQMVPEEHAETVVMVSQVAQGCFGFLSQCMKK
jgi:hypothetical protein